MSSYNSPCAACKFLRRKCTPECVFAPYFPPDQPQKFASVHKVFGASNVAKLLNELSAPQRDDAVTSLTYEAQERLRDPVYGCVSLISYYQQKLKIYQYQLYNAKKELSSYVGPSAMMPIIQHPSLIQTPYGLQMAHPAGAGQLVIRDQQTNPGQLPQMMDSHQHQEMVRAYEYQQQLLQHRQAQAMAQTQASHFQLGLNSGIDQGGPGPVTVAGYEQIAGLGCYVNPCQLQQQDQSHHHQQLQQHLQHHHHFQLHPHVLVQQQRNVERGEASGSGSEHPHSYHHQQLQIQSQLLIQQQQNMERGEGSGEHPPPHHHQEVHIHSQIDPQLMLQKQQQEEQYVESEEGRREQPLIHQFEIQEQHQLHHFEIDPQLLVQQQQSLKDDEGKREQPLIHQIQGEHDQEIDSHFLVHQPRQQQNQQHFEGEDESGVDPFL